MHFDIFNLPEPLTNEKQKECFLKFWTGDMNAREMLIMHNTRLVMQVIHDCYSDFYFIKNDLFQEGVVILTHAVDLFDITKGIEFSTYAYQSVKISLRRKIKNILSKECAFSSLHTEEEVVVNTMLVDHENDVSEQSDYRDLFSNFLEKFNKLPEIVQLVTKMRLGLFEYEQMTLSEIFERVPYA